jgi:surfeit locus 1 family protein
MKLKFFFFWLCFVILFFALGCWQLARYHDKKTLLETYQRQLSTKPVSLEAIQNPSEFQHVKISGHFINGETLFVQNRFYHDQLGYEVLTVFKTKDNNKYILVNRGWVARIFGGRPLALAPVPGLQNLTGHLKRVGEYQFILGENILDPIARPLVIQKIDLTEISQVLHHTFYPYVVRLDATSPAGFAREWTITSVTPERHMGYAVQWFLMAIVLLIVAIYFCFKDAARSDFKHFPLYGLLMTFILPLILAAVFFYQHNYFHFKQLNHGKLITPPIQISTKLYEKLNENNLKHRWIVLQVAKHCKLSCQVMHAELLQVQKALGNNRERVVILQKTGLPRPDAPRARNDEFLSQNFQNSQPLIGDQIYLIDPAGNIFMSYPKNANPLDILQDLKRLLEVSQIG